MAKYYAIKLTAGAARRLRMSLRDLFLEGVVPSAFQAIYEKNSKVQAKALYSTLKLACVEGLTAAEIATVQKISIDKVRARLRVAYQIALTYMEPKPIRDQLIRVVMGSRPVNFTHEEVQALIKSGGMR